MQETPVPAQAQTDTLYTHRFPAWELVF